MTQNKKVAPTEAPIYVGSVTMYFDLLSCALSTYATHCHQHECEGEKKFFHNCSYFVCCFRLFSLSLHVETEKRNIMSIAEQTARNIYESYHLDTLTDDVKRHLVLLFFQRDNSRVGGTQDEFIPTVEGNEEYLRQRAMNAYIDILEGKYSTAEEMESRLEAKYPWLCE